MSKIKKSIKYIDDDGEYLLSPKEVVQMTPELEKELEDAIELVQECGYYLGDGNEGKTRSMDYTSKNHVMFYLGLSVLQVLTIGILIYEGLDKVAYLFIVVLLFLLFAIYRTIKSQ